MKVLFDANTPAPLSHFLRGHDVVRADELGWQGMENGAQTGQIVRLDVAKL